MCIRDIGIMSGSHQKLEHIHCAPSSYCTLYKINPSPQEYVLLVHVQPWAESTWSAVGVVGRRDQYKSNYLQFSLLVMLIPSKTKHVFAVFDSLVAIRTHSGMYMPISLTCGSFHADDRHTNHCMHASMNQTSNEFTSVTHSLTTNEFTLSISPYPNQSCFQYNVLPLNSLLPFQMLELYCIRITLHYCII